jgi:hypothetical protein
MFGSDFRLKISKRYPQLIKSPLNKPYLKNVNISSVIDHVSLRKQISTYSLRINTGRYLIQITFANFRRLSGNQRLRI